MNRFKTEPMPHQLRALTLMKDRVAFALLMEQGTGKTKIIIDDAARAWSEHKIDALFVLAPNGVHTKWITSEIPKHMPDWCEWIGTWYSAGATQRHRRELEKLYETDQDGKLRKLRVFAMNYDAVVTNDGLAEMDRFTGTFRAMGVVDESQRIKNPKAISTGRILKLRRRFPLRRILSGTPVTRAPFDIFSQYQFLDETILRTSSYTAFKSEYADMLPENHWLVKNMKGDRWRGKDGQRNKRMPQIVARDAEGKPIYRNLEKLQRLIAPHSFRVLKSECLKLPEKIYDVLPFEMTPRQEQLYQSMLKERRVLLSQIVEQSLREGKRAGLSAAQVMELNRELIVQNKLSAMAKLHQIAYGYLKLEDGTVQRMFKKLMDNPANKVLMESVEDADDGGIIIWAPHTDKIDQIIGCLRMGYDDKEIVRYDGAVSKADRMHNIDEFEAGRARFFVGNPASGGVGLTLVAAQTVYYYSNSFNLEHRLQSEDRAHRIGQTKHVRYFDLEALGTIDRIIVESNQMKKRIADVITGDAEL